MKDENMKLNQIESLRPQLEQAWRVGNSLCKCKDCACCETYKMFKTLNDINPAYWLKHAKYSHQKVAQ